MGPQIQYLLWSVYFSLGAGPHTASENVACNPKSAQKMYFTVLKVAPEAKFVT